MKHRPANRDIRISIINGLCVNHDAISTSVVGAARAIEEGLGVRPRVYTYACDFDDLDSRIVHRLSDIWLDEHFRRSDYVIYHFGVYYDLFNTIFLAPQSAARIVRFHNVTPAALLGGNAAVLIEKSLNQIANIGCADAIWADSAFNRQDLVTYGIDPAKITVEPLFVKDEILRRPSPTQMRAKADSDAPVEILFVGRFVPSKGVLDIVEAAAACAADGRKFKIRLVGNTDFSDQDYIRKVRARITALNLDPMIDFIGRVDDATLCALYQSADIFLMPSYHEGFCVPLIEAFAAGCIPLVYEAGNLGALAHDLGDVIETGDVAQLARALAARIDAMGSDPSHVTIAGKTLTRSAYDKQVQTYLETFRYKAFAKRTCQGVIAAKRWDVLNSA